MAVLPRVRGAVASAFALAAAYLISPVSAATVSQYEPVAYLSAFRNAASELSKQLNPRGDFLPRLSRNETMRKMLNARGDEVSALLPGFTLSEITNSVNAALDSALYKNLASQPQLSDAVNAMAAVLAAQKAIASEESQLLGVKDQSSGEGKLVVKSLRDRQKAKINIIGSIFTQTANSVAEREIVMQAVDGLRNELGKVSGVDNAKAAVRIVNNAIEAYSDVPLAPSPRVAALGDSPLMTYAPVPQEIGDIQFDLAQRGAFAPLLQAPKARMLEYGVPKNAADFFNLSKEQRATLQQLGKTMRIVEADRGRAYFDKVSNALSASLFSQTMQFALTPDGKGGETIMPPAAVAAFAAADVGKDYAAKFLQLRQARAEEARRVGKDLSLLLPSIAETDVLMDYRIAMVKVEVSAKALAKTQPQRVLVEYVMNELFQSPMLSVGQTPDEIARNVLQAAASKEFKASHPNAKVNKKGVYEIGKRIALSEGRANMKDVITYGPREGLTAVEVTPLEELRLAKLAVAEAENFEAGFKSAIKSLLSRRLTKDNAESITDIIMHVRTSGRHDYEPLDKPGHVDKLPMPKAEQLRWAKEAVREFNSDPAGYHTFFMDRETTNDRGDSSRFNYNMYSLYGHAGKIGVEGWNHELNLGEVQPQEVRVNNEKIGVRAMTLYWGSPDIKVSLGSDKPQPPKPVKVQGGKKKKAPTVVPETKTESVKRAASVTDKQVKPKADKVAETPARPVKLSMSGAASGRVGQALHIHII